MLLVLNGAPNHRCGNLAVPGNITLVYLPSYSPELNPNENHWDEIHEKIFKNYALKSTDAGARQAQGAAVACIDRNPKLVRSITSFPISSIHSDRKFVSDKTITEWRRLRDGRRQSALSDTPTSNHI
jgi:transposase